MLYLEPVMGRDETPTRVRKAVEAMAHGFDGLDRGLRRINRKRTVPLVQGTGINAGMLTYNDVVVGIVRGLPLEKPPWM